MVMSQPGRRAVAVVELEAADAQKLLVGEVLVGGVMRSPSYIQPESCALDPAGFQGLG